MNLTSGIGNLLRRAFLAVMALVGLAAPVTASEPHLGAVRVVASDPKILTKVVEVARSAGWTRTTSDRPDRVTIFVPDNYTPDDFGRLLQALEGVKSRDFGLQMIDSLGRLIGPDGKPMEDTL